MAVKLGSKVKDTISGFTGTVVGRTEYLHSTPSLGVSPDTLKEGVPQDVAWFSEARFEVVEEPKT